MKLKVTNKGDTTRISIRATKKGEGVALKNVVLAAFKSTDGQPFNLTVSKVLLNLRDLGYQGEFVRKSANVMEATLLKPRRAASPST